MTDMDAILKIHSLPAGDRVEMGLGLLLGVMAGKDGAWTGTEVAAFKRILETLTWVLQGQWGEKSPPPPEALEFFVKWARAALGNVEKAAPHANSCPCITCDILNGRRSG